jgi:hypothetical protein
MLITVEDESPDENASTRPGAAGVGATEGGFHSGSSSSTHA